jgi:hypothetical protein
VKRGELIFTRRLEIAGNVKCADDLDLLLLSVAMRLGTAPALGGAGPPDGSSRWREASWSNMPTAAQEVDPGGPSGGRSRVLEEGLCDRIGEAWHGVGFEWWRPSNERDGRVPDRLYFSRGAGCRRELFREASVERANMLRGACVMSPVYREGTHRGAKSWQGQGGRWSIGMLGGRGRSCGLRGQPSVRGWERVSEQ